MSYWTINGRQMTDAEYREYERQKELERQKVQEESNRLSRELGRAYAALKEHLRRNAGTAQQVDDDRAQDQHLYQTLRQNLERANQAPRCGTMREDGTWCRSPRLKNNVNCYAHYRMKQAQATKLPLAAVQDANAVQMAIMQVQKWLIDDEISEKKAGLLLYSLQLAATNVGKTTFGQAKDEDLSVAFVGDEELIETERQRAAEQKRLEEIRKNSPLINTDDSDRKDLPRINADERGLEKGLPLMNTDDTDRKEAEEEGKTLPLINADNTDTEALGKMLPQPAGAEVYANRAAGAEIHANLG